MPIQCVCIVCTFQIGKPIFKKIPIHQLEKKAKNTTADDFYTKLKLSIQTDIAITLNETEFANLPTNLAEGFSRIKKIYECNNIHKAAGTKYYCIIGVELAYVKFLQFANKCATFLKEVDFYNAIRCNVCIINNKKNITKYFKQVRDNTSYSKTHINFLINLAQLCMLYPKFKCTAMSIDKIKSNMSWLQDRMPQDAEFWKIA
jgi:hypothetical protein